MEASVGGCGLSGGIGAAAQALAMTTLRAVVGEMDLDDVLSKRERINSQLQVKLDEVTVNWGVKVTRVEIKEVEPPRDVQEAMNRQLSAERTRRAAVTEAEGERTRRPLVRLVADRGRHAGPSLFGRLGAVAARTPPLS